MAIKKESPTMKALAAKKGAPEPEAAPVETASGALLKKGAAKAKTAIEHLDETSSVPVEEVKVKEDKKKTLSSAMKEDDLDLLQQIQQELEVLDAVSACSLAKSLINDTGVNDFKLGGVLAAIQEHGWWEGQGFDNFKGYVEAEYGLAYRKAMYLITIFNGLVTSGVPYEKVKHLGWTKLRELAGIMNLENMDEWLERAENMTVVQLVDYIKASQTAGASDSDIPVTTKVTDLTTRTFKLHQDQKEVIEAAIEKAKKEFSTEFDAVALENIAMTYIEGTTGKKGSTDVVSILSSMTLETAIETFEKAFPNAQLSLEVEE